MAEFELTDAQGLTMEVLVGLIGMTGVAKMPEQGGDVILDLLPASHVVTFSGFPDPFCVRIPPDGSMRIISDKEAGCEREGLSA